MCVRERVTVSERERVCVCLVFRTFYRTYN